MKRRLTSRPGTQVREVTRQERCQALKRGRIGGLRGQDEAGGGGALWVGWQRATNTLLRRLDLTLRVIGSHGRPGSRREP